MHKGSLDTQNSQVGLISDYNSNGLDNDANLKLKYDALIQSVPDGLILIKDGKIKYANKTFSNLLGYSESEVVTLQLQDIISPENLPVVIDRYNRRMDGENVPTQYQSELIHKDGKQLIPVSLNVGVVDSEDDKLEFLMIRDLSEKLEIERRFENEINLQQYFMDFIPDSIYFKDLDSKFIKVNKATLSKLGFNKYDDVIGKTDFDLFSKEHAEEARKDELEIINKRISVINKIEKETWLDGKTTWAATTKIPLIDKNNNVYGTFGITRDMTELKKAEEIKDALFKISTAVTTKNNIDELYTLIHNTISELMPADNFYIAMYHEETDTVFFPYWVDQIDPQPGERKAEKGLTEYVLRTSKAQLIDAELDLKLRAAGETSLLGEPTQIWLGVPLKVEGKAIGVIVLQDYYNPATYGEAEKDILIYISEQIAFAINKKQSEKVILDYSEELKETNAAKDKFFSILAHDLKSPFHGLLGLSRMIVEEYDSMEENEIKTYLKIIKESTESTYKLIEKLLEWSRLESGKMKYSPALQNMFMIVEDTRILLNQNARMKRISLRNKLAHQSFIWGDDTMLQSLVQNLISNSIKFTLENGTIEVTEKQFDTYIEYTVSDTGVGIKESDIEKLFRVDLSFSTKGTHQEKGTGLGLALCNEIVNLHGGKITVKSILGKGTSIIFTLNKPKSY